MNTVTVAWVGWIHSNWALLHARAHLEVPTYLPHPCVAGFDHEPLATPEGQSDNWVVALTDGSRIHVHEFADGRLVAHRDQYDPRRSVGHFVAHVMTETALPVLLLVGLIVFAGRSAARA